MITFWGMRVGKHSLQLTAGLKSGTGPIRIQSPHSLFRDLPCEEINLYNLLARRQSSSFSPSLSPCLSSLPQAIPEDNRRFWLHNQWPSSPSFWGSVLPRSSGIPLAGQKEVLALLQYLLSSSVKEVWYFVNFGLWRVTDDIFIHVNEIWMYFASTYYLSKLRS